MCMLVVEEMARSPVAKLGFAQTLPFPPQISLTVLYSHASLRLLNLFIPLHRIRPSHLREDYATEVRTK